MVVFEVGAVADWRIVEKGNNSELGIPMYSDFRVQLQHPDRGSMPNRVPSPARLHDSAARIKKAVAGEAKPGTLQTAPLERRADKVLPRHPIAASFRFSLPLPLPLPSPPPPPFSAGSVL